MNRLQDDQITIWPDYQMIRWPYDHINQIAILTRCRAASSIGNTDFLSVTDFFAQKGIESPLARLARIGDW